MKSWIYNSKLHNYSIIKERNNPMLLSFHGTISNIGPFAILMNVYNHKDSLLQNIEFSIKDKDTTLYWMHQKERIIFTFELNHIIFRGSIQNHKFNGTICFSNYKKIRFKYSDIFQQQYKMVS